MNCKTTFFNINVIRSDSVSCCVMFANMLVASILFNTLVITSVAAAGLVDSFDGNDRPVVTTEVVLRTAGACNGCNQIEFCTINVQAYSGDNSTSCNGANEGFVKLNGKTVWSAGWCSSLADLSGITIVDVDTRSCTATNVQTFDTHASESNAVALATYLRRLPPGAVIVGVTGDDPMSNLGPALETLNSMQVDVRDVRERDNFAFVLQKDYSFQPIVAKGLEADVTPATINLRVEEDCGILLQQHYYGTAYFNRSRTEYRNGFGVETGNYWIGLDRLHSLTIDGKFKLRIELLAKYNSEWYWAEYETFRVLDDRADYVLWIGGYNGTSGDPFSANTGMKFSTKDRIVDNSCGASCATHPTYGNNAGFWYSNCGSVFINSPDTGYYGFAWTTLPITGPAPNIYKLVISRMYLIANEVQAPLSMT